VAAGAFVVLFCTGFQLTGHAIKRLTAFTVNLTFNLEPLYGIILAFAVFGESKELSWSFFIGLALIAASLVIHVILLLKEERKIQIQMSLTNYQQTIVDYYRDTENAYKDSWDLDNSLAIHYGYWDEKSEIVPAILTPDE